MNEPQYEQALLQHFSSITIENALKWASLIRSGAYDFSGIDEYVDFTASQGQRLRGHALVWARFNGTPEWVKGSVEAASDPRAHLTELLQNHIATVVGRYRGRIETWDVVNEPLGVFSAEPDNNLYYETLGLDYIALAFEAAKKADPDARLVLNEFAIHSSKKFDGLVKLVTELRARGVPIDGVGLQGHLWFGMYLGRPPLNQAGYEAAIDRLAATGVTVEFTEVDIPLWLFRGEPDPLASQARAYGELFAACANRPACIGVTVWGVDDDDSWLDEDLKISLVYGLGQPAKPLLLDESFGMKPAYDAAVEALRRHLPSGS